MGVTAQGIQCKGTKRDGQRCTNPAVIGAMVCRMHGAGGTPENNPTREKARRLTETAEQYVMRRLEAHLGDAVETLEAIMLDDKARPADKQRAAEAIVNRFAPQRVAASVETVTAAERDLDAELEGLVPESLPEAETG